MQVYGKILVKDGWAICPVCGKGKMTKVLPDTYAGNLPCWCKLCHKERIVNIAEPVPASNVTSA